MRLIDVEELKKRAAKVMFRDAPECGEFDAVAVDDIDCMPTIDPETLRSTAKWLQGYYCTWKCSSCNGSSYPKSKYCKNCGARMVNSDE